MARKPAAAPAPKARAGKPDAIDPKHRWDRPIQAPGHTQVDFEERVDFRRLHEYRLGRTRRALARSGLGALLLFDQYNIRYISGTVIGEWRATSSPAGASSPATASPGCGISARRRGIIVSPRRSSPESVLAAW